jgi:LPXTG-motif cell wall-anchored protein
MRWAAGAVATVGLVASGATATPSAAQEPPPTTAVAPTTTTTAPPPTTVAPPPATPPTTSEAATTTTTVAQAEATDSSAPPTTATSVPAPPSGAPAAAGVTLTLDIPAGAEVVDGERLGITVTGLPPVGYLELAQCADGPEPLYERCAYEDGSYEIVNDTVHATVRLDAVISVGGFEGPAREVDCRATPCRVQVEYFTTDGSASTVDAALPFDADGPLAPPPTATITPAGPYAHQQSVTVQAAGLVWASSAAVVQCAAGTTGWAGCDSGTERYLYLDDAATSGATAFRLLAVIDSVDGPVDCRVAGACELVVTQGRSGMSAAKSVRLPLTFDPTTEVVPPTLEATPADGLVHGQTVTISGTGFVDDYLQLMQCAAVDDEPETCIWLSGWGEPGPTGSFTAQVRVSGFVPTPGGEVDCRRADDPCSVVATPSQPDSSRAGRATLGFDPDAPLPAPPSITVTPSTDLGEEETVTVTGTGFGGLDGESTELSVCETGTVRCDEAAGSWLEPTADGGFTTQVTVAASFRSWDGTVVDCRAAPGCSVVARDGYAGRSAAAALTFGDPPTMADRYRLPVFDDVEVTSDVVYRRTTDAAGAAVDLTLDVYQPAGDTVAERPAVVWLAGGWFQRGARDLQPYAEAFARRGYVAVTMTYRARPGLVCCPTDDIEGVTAAVADATADAAAGARWLRDHADEYGIDPDAIAVGGAQGGAAAAFGAAHVANAPIAAALPVDGVGFGRPRRGDPPFLAVHELRDSLAPAHLSEWACGRARSTGTTCSTTELAGSYGDFVFDRRRPIVAETSAFLADVVLAPLGYVEPSGRDWGGSGGPGGPGGPGGSGGPGPVTPVATAVPGAALAGTLATGRLPATGLEVGHLVALALGLCLVGGATLAARRRGRGGVDRGSARLWVAAGSAVVLVVAGFAVTSALGPDDDAGETAGGEAVADEDAATDEHDAMDHDAMDHDAMDHDDGHRGMNHAAVDHAAIRHDDDHEAGAAHRDAAGPDGDGHAHTGVSGTNGGHGHAGAPAAPGHDHPGGPGSPTDPPGTGHDHPDHPDPPDPEPPVTGFDPSWTPAQVAYANQLIADTQEQLERYDNIAILPLTGYQWIKDGKGVGSYQHWINLGRIVDPRRLDAAFPESLVLRTTADGPKLEAAMYMLSPQFHMGNIPADIAWLPGWHIHDNLCFVGYELVGVTVNGRCERGSVLPTPPMIHVWREPTECGWFAGIDEFGLQCHHEH